MRRDFLDGRLPYRDVFVEYPPGAFVVLLPPAIVTDDHYRTLFKILMAAVALGGLWCVARLLLRLGAGRLRPALAWASSLSARCCSGASG